MATAFDKLDAWHGDAPPADRHHNQPPLEERVTMEFEEQLRSDGLTDRIKEITESAGRVPAIDQAVAGKVGDLITLARTCRKTVEERREAHNRPLLNAQRALKGRADALLAPMDDAITAVKNRLNDFMAEEARKAREAQRLADEQARIARDAAEQAAREAAERNEPAPPPPPPVIEPARVEQPVARGDMGARVGTRTVWKHKIESVRQLPDAILKNERVIEALDKVIAAQIRGGTRAIKGVTIWDEQVADVR